MGGGGGGFRRAEAMNEGGKVTIWRASKQLTLRFTLLLTSSRPDSASTLTRFVLRLLRNTSPK